MWLGDMLAFRPPAPFPFAAAAWDVLLPGGGPGRARGAKEGSAAPKGLLRVCGCLGGFAAGSTLLVAKKPSLKDPVSPLCTGALPLGAPSQGKVLRCTAELGICTAGALLGPTVVLLERMTLKLLTGFSYHGPDTGFMAAPSLVAREPVRRGAGTVPSSPPLRRSTSGLACLIPGGAVSGRVKLAPAEDLFISPSLCLLPGAALRSRAAQSSR